MKPSTLLRLALAGTRTDTLRVLLTGVSATLGALAFLAALTVAAIPTPPRSDPDDWSSNWSQQYSNALLREPGLRPGVIVTLVLLTIPVLALAGQCARLGAPARDRRLAAIRLAGATPGQAVAISAGETGVASLLGTVVGLGGYLLGRWLLHRPDATGRLALPTDVLPPAGAIAAVVLVLPLVAALAAVVLLRRVVVTPRGVVRRVRRTRAPRPWPAVFIVFGLAVPPVFGWLVRNDRLDFAPAWHGWLLTIFFGSVTLAALGVVLSAAWISYATGWVLHRFARSPAALLAARRLIADPWANSRTFAALLTCLVFAGGAAWVRAFFRVLVAMRAESHEGAGAVPSPDDFYLRTVDLVDLAVLVALVIAVGGLLIALAEGIVARRRSYAALVATGVPRAALGGSIAWHALAPAVPAVVLALAVGLQMGRSYFGEPQEERVTDAGATVERAVAVPFGDLAVFGGAALLAVLATVGVGLIFLRSSTDLEELRVG
jgi:hypothetical protein